jgi:hypothetical protein
VSYRYDIDKNDKYSPPPKGSDRPIAKKKINLVDLKAGVRAVPVALGSTVTDGSGNFKMTIDQPNSVIEGGLKLSLISNELIGTLQVDPNSPSGQREIPLPRPAKVSRFSDLAIARILFECLVLITRDDEDSG